MDLLDELAPRFDFALREHIAVEAPGPVVYSALAGSGTRRCRCGVPTVRPRRNVPGFDELLTSARWVPLGRRPGEEIVTGAAGRFWTPYMDWCPLTPAEFAVFDRPCRATIAVSLSVGDCGAGRCVLSFEARVRATDAVAFRWADWYWHQVRPSAGVVVRDLLHSVRSVALATARQH
ncbi:MAG TPA: hypothetical protein VHC18_22175 [Amycolatopsis sp.]|nr:hypothetical protein [Amycolatopsis sp.]